MVCTVFITKFAFFGADDDDDLSDFMTASTPDEESRDPGISSKGFSAAVGTRRPRTRSPRPAPCSRTTRCSSRSKRSLGCQLTPLNKGGWRDCGTGGPGPWDPMPWRAFLKLRSRIIRGTLRRPVALIKQCSFSSSHVTWCCCPHIRHFGFFVVLQMLRPSGGK